MMQTSGSNCLLEVEQNIFHNSIISEAETFCFRYYFMSVRFLQYVSPIYIRELGVIFYHVPQSARNK